MMKIKIKCEEGMLQQFQDCWQGSRGYETPEIAPEYISSVNEVICQLDWHLSEPKAENIYYSVPHLKSDTDEEVTLPVNSNMDMYSAVLYYCAMLHSIGLHPLLMVCENYVLAGVWLDEQSRLEEEPSGSMAVEELLYAEGGNLLLVDVWQLLQHRQPSLILDACQYDGIRSEKNCIVDFEKENAGEDYLILVEQIEEYIEVQYIDVQQAPYTFHFGKLSRYDEAVVNTIAGTAGQLLIDGIPAPKQCCLAAEAALSALLQQKTVLLLAPEEETAEIRRLGQEHSCGDMQSLFSSECAVPPAVSAEESVPDITTRRSFTNILSFMQQLQQTKDEQTDRFVYEYFEEYLHLDEDTLRWKEQYLLDEGQLKDRSAKWGRELEKVTQEIMDTRMTYGEHTTISIDIRKMSPNRYRLFSQFVSAAEKAHAALQKETEKLMAVCEVQSVDELMCITKLLDMGKDMLYAARHPEQMPPEQLKKAEVNGRRYGDYRNYICIRQTYFDEAGFESIGLQQSEDIVSHKQNIAQARNGIAQSKTIMWNLINRVALNSRQKTFPEFLDIIEKLLNRRASLISCYDEMQAVSDIFGEHVNDGTILYQLKFVTECDGVSDNMKQFMKACAADAVTYSNDSDKWLVPYQQYTQAYAQYQQAIAPPQEIFKTSKQIDEKLLQKWIKFVNLKVADTYFNNLQYLSERFSHVDSLVEEENLSEKMRRLIMIHNTLSWAEKFGIHIENYSDRKKRYDSLHSKMGKAYRNALCAQQASIRLVSFAQMTAGMEPSDITAGAFDVVMVCGAEQSDEVLLHTLSSLCRDSSAFICMTQDRSRSASSSVAAFLSRIPMAVVYDNVNETGDNDGTDISIR